MDFTGRIYNTRVVSSLDESGHWFVNITITEKRTSNGVDWEEAKMEASAFDTNREDAERVALQSVLAQMDDEVYSKGYTSLLDVPEEEGKDASDIKDNEDTKS